METVVLTPGSDLIGAVDRIYCEAIPERERVPLDHLIQKGGNIKVSAITESGETVAFCCTIGSDHYLFVFYLAVSRDQRGKGLGGRVLEEICSSTDLPVVLNVDEVSEEYDDFAVRKRRLDFYLAHGFKDTGSVLVDAQGTFNVLCRGEFDKDLFLELMQSFGSGCTYR